MIDLQALTQFLDHYFAVTQFGSDQGGVYRGSTRVIQRLGLALEPWPAMATWAGAERLDAVFVHRPWKLQPYHLLQDIGVVAYHLAFDERLTLGYNVRLADALSLSMVEVLGDKEGRPLGMIGALPRQPFAAYTHALAEVFGGMDKAHAALSVDISRVAVVGAMTDALVREAAERGADLYVTGQFRHPAQLAVAETGIGVVVVGHRRSEEWGLRALAAVLRERWSTLSVVVHQ